MNYCTFSRLARSLGLLGLLAALGFAVLLQPAPTFGQIASCSLSGTVYDSSGALVPGADIKLTNEATKTSSTTTSNSSGFFSFPFLLPGSYTATVSMTGFNTWELRNVVLHTGESRSLTNIALNVSGTSTTVEVVATAVSMAPVDTGENSTTLNSNMVTNLAIQGRNASELIKVLPGVTMTQFGQTPWDSQTTKSNTGPVGSFTASGTQPYGGMQMTLDGGVIIDTGNMGTQIANVNQDQTAELTVRNSAFDAEYAHGPITVNAVSKTGTSALHGAAYLYARGATFNAEDSYFKSQNISKPNDHYWYPGFNVGGPVRLPWTDFNKHNDKLFFFAGYEYMIQHPQGSIHQVFVPTANMLNGNFTAAEIASAQRSGWDSASIPCSNTGAWNYNNFCRDAIHNGLITMYQPSPNTSTPWTAAQWETAIAAGTPLATSGAQFASGVIDPIGSAYMNMFPPPNVDPSSHQGYNWLGVDNPPFNRWELKLRGDYNISQNSRLYFSYNRQHETDINNYGIWWVPRSVVPYPSSFPAIQITNLWSTGFTHVFSPTLTNETTFNFTSFINPIKFANPAAADPSKTGVNVTLPYDAKVAPMIPNTFNYTDWDNGRLPMFWAPGFAAGWQNGAFGALKRVPSLSDNIAWVKGTHTFKFGFSWDRWGNQQTDGVWQGNQAFPQGSFEFETYAQQSTGNPMADMLLGKANAFNQYAPDYVHTLWFTEAAFYAQDHWKVNRRLTLDFGIRFDHEGQWAPSGNTPGVPVFDPSTCTSTGPGPTCVGADLPGFTWNGRNSKIPISGFESTFVQPDPRVGAAFDVFGNGKTVVRGGFGMYRYQFAYNSIPLNAPLGVQVFQTNCAISSWAQATTDPNCVGNLTPIGQLPASNSGLAVNAVSKGDNKTPYTQNWNIIIDQRGPWNSLFSIGYNGSRSRNLLLGANNGNLPNRVPLGGYFAPDPVTGTNSCMLPLYDPEGCTGNGLPANTSQHFRPYNYAGIQVNTHASYSNYNAFQFSWQKQAGRSTFLLNYTWSKTMGIRDGETDNGGNGNGAMVNPFNLASNYGVLAYDRAHVFNAAYVFDLPSFVRGNSFGERIAQGIVNGWVISGVTQLQSGQPLQPNSGGNMNVTYPGTYGTQQVLGTDAGRVVPTLVCDPRKGLQSGYYFNPDCFAPTIAQGSFGNIIWPYIHGPAFFNSDLGVYKTFKITERQKLEFRAEAFNFLNHPLPDFTLNTGTDLSLSFNQSGCNYGGFTGLCQSNVNSGTTGKPTYTVGRRVMEFSIKYIF